METGKRFEGSCFHQDGGDVRGSSRDFPRKLLLLLWKLP